jgi:hypothetical protein
LRPARTSIIENLKLRNPYPDRVDISGVYLSEPAMLEGPILAESSYLQVL